MRQYFWRSLYTTGQVLKSAASFAQFFLFLKLTFDILDHRLLNEKCKLFKKIKNIFSISTLYLHNEAFPDLYSYELFFTLPYVESPSTLNSWSSISSLCTFQQGYILYLEILQKMGKFFKRFRFWKEHIYFTNSVYSVSSFLHQSNLIINFVHDYIVYIIHTSFVFLLV